MKKVIISIGISLFFTGCMFYTNGYENLVDLSSSDFSQSQELKKGSKCSLLILGVIPWPFGRTGPENELEAIEKALKKYKSQIIATIISFSMLIFATISTVIKSFGKTFTAKNKNHRLMVLVCIKSYFYSTGLN